MYDGLFFIYESGVLKMVKLLLVLFLVYLITINSIESSDKVLELNEDNFAEEVQLHDAMLVMFYAPW